MGGGHYSQDVAVQARSTSTDVFSYQGYGTDAGSAVSRREVHPLLNPHGRIRECMNPTSIVVALDVTRSRGNDTKIVYEKLPMFIGQIEMKGYVEGAAISFAAIGDATVDQAPLQASQFEADNRLDEALSKFWIEEGGGGSGQESYELTAYYYARHSVLDCLNKGKKGYFFFVGDEGFYPEADKYQIKDVCGFDVPGNISSAEIFRELQEKYHVFFIYPQKSWEDRKSDIDAEIKQRVEAAGGQYQNVDIRASLIWNNRNDLDLHVIAPSGEEIFYQNKQSKCGGWLDVDMNVQGESRKPVENVRWSKGQAPKGHYKIFVQNFAFHESKHAPTDYRVEVEINGTVRHFEGTVSRKGQTGGRSNVTVFEFDYDPAKRVTAEPKSKKDLYSGYDDKVIKEQWASVLPPENIILIDDPGAILDVMLGALAITAGSSDLDGYLSDMRGLNSSEQRLEQTSRALGNLAAGKSAARISIGNIPSAGGGKNRGGGTERL